MFKSPASVRLGHTDAAISIDLQGVVAKLSIPRYPVGFKEARLFRVDDLQPPHQSQYWLHDSISVPVCML